MTPTPTKGLKKWGIEFKLKFSSRAKSEFQTTSLLSSPLQQLSQDQEQDHIPTANMPVSKKMKVSLLSDPFKICSLLTSYHRSNATTRKQRQQEPAPPSKPTVCPSKHQSRHLSYVSKLPIPIAHKATPPPSPYHGEPKLNKPVRQLPQGNRQHKHQATRGSRRDARPEALAEGEVLA